jgi:membrane protein insertase Oxa1/YidC/SpoIIIJ
MEAPGDEYSSAKGWFWQFLKSLRSNLNPILSEYTFYVAFAALTIIVGLALFRIFNLFNATIKPEENV